MCQKKKLNSSPSGTGNNVKWQGDSLHAYNFHQIHNSLLVVIQQDSRYWLDFRGKLGPEHKNWPLCSMDNRMMEHIFGNQRRGNGKEITFTATAMFFTVSFCFFHFWLGPVMFKDSSALSSSDLKWMHTSRELRLFTMIYRFRSVWIYGFRPKWEK